MRWLDTAAESCPVTAHQSLNIFLCGLLLVVASAVGNGQPSWWANRLCPACLAAMAGGRTSGGCVMVGLCIRLCHKSLPVFQAGLGLLSS
jgi:hypothetical protein